MTAGQRALIFLPTPFFCFPVEAGPCLTTHVAVPSHPGGLFLKGSYFYRVKRPKKWEKIRAKRPKNWICPLLVSGMWHGTSARSAEFFLALFQLSPPTASDTNRSHVKHQASLSYLDQSRRCERQVHTRDVDVPDGPQSIGSALGQRSARAGQPVMA